MEVKEYLENIKNEIKENSKYEDSLKSISFSIDIENRKLIIYFAWKQEDYDSYFREREIYRSNLINLLKCKHLYLNKNQSTSAKYIFYYRNEIK